MRQILAALMFLAGGFGLTGCATTAPTAPVDERQAGQGRTVYKETAALTDVSTEALESSAPITTAQWYTVRKGDTLYAIAFLHNLHFEDIAAWNSIRSPYLIRIGEKLRLSAPDGFARPPEATSVTAPTVVRPPVSAPVTRSVKPIAKAPPKPRPRAKISKPKAVPSGPLSWRWPTRGKMIKKFTTRGTSKRGIGIAGKPGQTIRAAAQGRVVYAGSGLVGYGKLVIIKHNKTFLSAYGHNRKLLVSEGDIVRSGDTIAEMGSTDATSTRLHFEIRKRGKSVNPLRYLPRS